MNATDDQIQRITEIIINDYNPDKVILFGSRARGDDRPGSDIDILVISDQEKHLPRYKAMNCRPMFRNGSKKRTMI